MGRTINPTLTDKQELFCRFYVANGHNVTKAAIDAGYSPKTAYATGSENMSKPDILARIKELEEPVLKELEITTEWVISKLKTFSEAKITDYFEIKDGDIRLKDFSQLTPEQIDAIESIKNTANGIEIKLVDKKGSVVDIGKHLGTFSEKAEDRESLETFLKNRKLGIKNE